MNAPNNCTQNVLITGCVAILPVPAATRRCLLFAVTRAVDSVE